MAAKAGPKVPMISRSPTCSCVREANNTGSHTAQVRANDKIKKAKHSLVEDAWTYIRTRFVTVPTSTRFNSGLRDLLIKQCVSRRLSRWLQPFQSKSLLLVQRGCQM